MGSAESVEQSREPYWLVVFELEDDEYASTSVEAPTEEEAETQAGRLIAAAEETGDISPARTTGPYPSSPGESAVEVRPHACMSCGLHLWQGEQTPCPRSTWFTRARETENGIAWKCIQCGAETMLSNDQMAGGVRADA
jgi:hypothetical protein